jgi:hypothetical protein
MLVRFTVNENGKIKGHTVRLKSEKPKVKKKKKKKT